MNNNDRRFSLFPKPLQQAVETVTKPAFKRFGLAQARLISDWPHIAGAVLAGKTLPQRLQFPKGQRDGGTLYLAVQPGWALEVQHLEPVILEKIATYFGYKAVARLHITQQPLPAPEMKKKLAASPLPPKSQEQLEQITAQVADPALKSALEKLGEGIFAENRKTDKAP